jgi:hypothetical protein
MTRPATPTPRPTPLATPPTAAPSDRLVRLALSGTVLWVLGWVGIQLSGVLR